MTINDNSIFDTTTPLKKIEPSRTRVIVYTTNMEEQRPVSFNEGNIGAATVNGDDVSQYYKEVTVNYISKQTQDAGNEYQISKGSTTITVRNADGSPAAISDNIGGVIKSFADTFISDDSSKALSTFKQSSNSQFLELNVKKGKGLNAQDPSVIELYNQIKPENQTDPGLLPTTVQQRLTENNLLNPNSKLINGEQSVKEGIENKIGSLTLQPKIGSHAPRKFPSVNSENSAQITGQNLETLTIEELKNLASRILFSSTGGIITEEMPQELIDSAPGEFSSLGIKVPFNRFTATEVVKTVNPNFVKPTLNIELSDETKFSYGSIYLPNAAFNSLANSNSLVKTIVKTVMLAIAGTSDLARTLPPLLAAAVPVPVLTRTNNKAVDCLNAGFKMFFSGRQDSYVWDPNSSDTGFQNTVLRRLLSILLKELGLDTYTLPDVFTLTSIGVNLTKSRFIRVMSLILQAGDRAINIAQSAGINPNDYTGEFPDIINSKQDLIDVNFGDNSNFIKINPASLIGRSKLSTSTQSWLYNTKTSWAMGSTPSLYILPEGIRTAERRLTGATRNTDYYLVNKYVKESPTNRFTRDEVKQVEQVLDASYVPFYFHDLRTNEIISFHAFIKSLDDSFQVAYESSHPYGRADPIHIYRNTERTIRTQFIVAAVNQEDFSQMWLKINKFLTMIYPQYTAGRQLTGPDGSRFIQPFSQVPAASPMVRMRIGDLVKSNYSTFGVGRLFGLAQLNAFTPAAPAAPAVTSVQIESRMNRSDFQPQESFTIQPVGGALPTSEDAEAQYCISAVETFPDQRISPFKIARTIQGKVLTVLRVLEPGKYTVQLKNQDVDIEGLQGIKLNFPFQIELGNQREGIPWTTSVTPEQIAAAVAKVSTPIPQETINPVTFFSTTENPILKSFESTRGEGLAGFIKSVSFDWMMEEGIWETVGWGNRAPTMCKINIDFAPIFDIAPGMDSNGFMNAPVYPVGNASNALLINTDSDQTNTTKRESFDNYKTLSQNTIAPPIQQPDAPNTGRGLFGIPSPVRELRRGLGRNGIRFFGRDII